MKEKCSFTSQAVLKEAKLVFLLTKSLQLFFGTRKVFCANISFTNVVSQKLFIAVKLCNFSTRSVLPLHGNVQFNTAVFT